MNKIFNYLTNNKPLFIGILMIIVVICIGLYRQYRVRNYSVFTVARVDKFEGAEQGVDVYITIFYRDKKFKCIVDSWCLDCTGKYYFVKIDGENPSLCGRVQLYENNPVPECLVGKIPSNGWNEIPKDTCRTMSEINN
jgi:hypothetical protein